MVEPLRMCRACRTKRPQSELVRWTLVDGKLAADKGTKASGRGYYSCSERCEMILPKTLKGMKR